jgi:hypothetical protein
MQHTTMRLALVTVLVAGESAGAAEPPIRIDDFEDLDLEAAPGLSWVALGDWLMGGTSSGSVATVKLPAGERSRGALRIEGKLGNPERAFAGAWTALRGDGTGADLTGYAAIRFRLRGTPGRYVVGLRRSDTKSGGNFMAPVTCRRLVGRPRGAVHRPGGAPAEGRGRLLADRRHLARLQQRQDVAAGVRHRDRRRRAGARARRRGADVRHAQAGPGRGARDREARLRQPRQGRAPATA